MYLNRTNDIEFLFKLAMILCAKPKCGDLKYENKAKQNNGKYV